MNPIITQCDHRVDVYCGLCAIAASEVTIAFFKKIETGKRFEERYNRGAEKPQKKKNHSDLRHWAGFRLNLFANHYIFSGDVAEAAKKFESSKSCSFSDPTTRLIFALQLKSSFRKCGQVVL